MSSKDSSTEKSKSRISPKDRSPANQAIDLSEQQIETAESFKKATEAPKTLSSNDVLQLQRTVGNKDVVQLLTRATQDRPAILQTKPAIPIVSNRTPAGGTIQRVNGNGGGPPEAPPPPPAQVKSWAEKRQEGTAEKTKQEQLEEYGLNPGEIGALQLYTTSMYKLANDYLRGQLEDEEKQNKKHEIGRLMEGTGVQDPELNVLITAAGGVYSAEKQAQWMAVFERFLKLIVTGIQKLPTPETDQVSRGVNLETRPEFFEKHKEGSIITDPGFMSTAFGTPFAKDSIVVIQLPQGHPGRDISQLSAYEKEAEIIFPPGSGYKIEQILTKKDNAAEFNTMLSKLVEDQQELATRFQVVERIYITSLTMPK